MHLILLERNIVLEVARAESRSPQGAGTGPVLVRSREVLGNCTGVSGSVATSGFCRGQGQ